MAAPVRTNQVNQVIRHTRATFGMVVVNVNKRFYLRRRSRIHPKLSYQFIIAFSVCRTKLNLLSPLFVPTL